MTKGNTLECKIRNSKFNKMPKNIYIINTKKEDIYSLLSFFEELQIKNFNLLFFLIKSKIFKVAKEKKIKIKKLPKFLEDRSGFKKIFLLILSPFLAPGLIIFFYYLKKKKSLNAILFFGESLKIILRIPLSFLKIKMIWFENNSSAQPLKLFSRKAKRICFHELEKNNLIKKGVSEDKITILNPGLNAREAKRQDNIFNNLARENQNKNSISKKESKFFTIGTFADLNHENNLENLFLAIKKALIVISNIQLIVIGDGEKRKKLTWLAKKMQIDIVVWFVGEQERLGKWLDAFDLFVVSCRKAQLKDFEIVLKSLSAKIPIIVPFGIGFDNIIYDNKNGLIIEKEESEEILKAIIKLKKDKFLRKRLGENGFATVQNELSMENMVEGFMKIIE